MVIPGGVNTQRIQDLMLREDKITLLCLICVTFDICHETQKIQVENNNQLCITCCWYCTKIEFSLHCVSGMWTLHKSHFWYFHLLEKGKAFVAKVNNVFSEDVQDSEFLKDYYIPYL